jgi:hypothetical protein
VGWFQKWWDTLSTDEKAGIIAAIVSAIVSPFTANILDIRRRMIRQSYIRTLEKLDKAAQEIVDETHLAPSTRKGELIALSEDSSSLLYVEKVVKRAGVTLWWARMALRWKRRIDTFGEIDLIV